MSFSTMVNREGRKQLKVSCFEIMNLLAGINVCSIFDIKGKKKEIMLPSHFPKK